jgi:hypothetical protein
MEPSMSTTKESQWRKQPSGSKVDTPVDPEQQKQIEKGDIN